MKEKKEEQRVELINDEAIQHLIETIQKAEKDELCRAAIEGGDINTQKTTEVLESLKGQSVSTITSIAFEIFLILPIEAQIEVLRSQQRAFRKTLDGAITKLVKGNGVVGLK